MASLLSAGIMQRINQKALAQHWRWLALSAALLLGSTIYLLGRDRYPTVQYHELLATTHPDNYNCSAPITLGGTSRLARTLEGNERRYQYMLGEREKLIEKEGGSQIAVFPPPHGRYYVLWDFFIPAFSCPFPMYRVGERGFNSAHNNHLKLTVIVPGQLPDGGKWVCGLERVLHHRPDCVVYSLNTQTPAYSSFEVDILEKSSGCQIYGFDAHPTRDAPSKWPWGATDDLLRSRVHFNPFTIADPTAQRKYRSLRSVMLGLGHDWIDILKLDLKGSEFATLLAIIAENQGEPLPFGQLILTVQTGLSDDMRTVAQFQDWFTRLECASLRPFYFEVSMMDVNNRRDEPSIVYWSFINIRGRHALVDDSLPEYP